MAAGDLTDLATVKIAASIDDGSTGSDTVLSTLITDMSAYVIQVLNRNVLQDTYTEIYRGNGKERMLLRQRPVTLVSSVAWQGQTITAVGDPVAGVSGVWTDGINARLVGYCFPRDAVIQIVYQAGYVTVPGDISYAVAELVAEAFQRRKHVGETTRSANGVVTTGFDMRTMHAAIADKLQNYLAVAPC
jgi:hypothetical protein